MPASADSRAVLCVARQPILNKAGRVFGYELLYRDRLDAAACTVASNLASSRVLSDAVLAVGLDRLTGGRPAFVNFTRALLTSGAGNLLPPSSIVIEILEDVQVDKDVMTICRQLRARGYALALDDFVPGSSAEQLVPYARYVKVDVLATGEAERRRLAERLKPAGITLVAEKVETQQMVDSVLGNGYGLVQGYYFCRPTTFATSAMPARKVAHLRLFSALSSDNLTIEKLENLIKTDVSLSYRVLRSVNSAAFGVQCEISSVRQALVLLGLDFLRKWASVWALAGLNDGGTQETMSVALLRARCCEVLGAMRSGAEEGHGCFLLGLCSLLDVICGQPMEEVLHEMPLSSETRKALLGGSNQQRAMLDAVIAYEQGDWDRATGLLAPLRLDADALPHAYTDALKWVRELSGGSDPHR
jgi:EAL and modified HD-GYP domain-containing signal transduction protein